MTKWVRSGVLDNGLNDIKNNAIRMLLVSAYSAGDSYATVVANKLAEVVMAAGDFTLSSSGSNRLLTTATKTDSAADATIAAGSNLHIVFTDNVSAVIWATDETTDMAITAGNPVDFPALVYTFNQPT